MNENREQNELKEKEYNTPIPTVNFNGTPNPNTMASNQEHNKHNNHTRVRRPLQYNSYMMNRLTRNGYIGLQILIIILTLATILGILIGANIYVYTK